MEYHMIRYPDVVGARQVIDDDHLRRMPPRSYIYLQQVEEDHPGAKVASSSKNGAAVSRSYSGYVEWICLENI